MIEGIDLTDEQLDYLWNIPMTELLRYIEHTFKEGDRNLAAKHIASALAIADELSEPISTRFPTMKRFSLIRNKDITGVSGTGHVADGCLFADGRVVVAWGGKYPTTTIYDSMDAVMHGGNTEIEWIDSLY